MTYHFAKLTALHKGIIGFFIVLCSQVLGHVEIHCEFGPEFDAFLERLEDKRNEEAWDRLRNDEPLQDGDAQRIADFIDDRIG